MTDLTLCKILRAMGVELEPARVKLVRHQDARYDIPYLLSCGQFEVYQANQGKPVFRDCDHILAFSADGGSRSEFLGLYRVAGVVIDAERQWPESFPYYQRLQPGSHWYDLAKDARLASLERRLVIDWGTATRSWHQWLNPDLDKLVVEVRAPGRRLPFPGYDEVTLSFEELSGIIANPDANPDWHHALNKVSGVYLIQDATSGDLYVGSAYGMDGIWGRWACYMATCHGGNVRLRALCEACPDRHRSFRYSILKTLPLSADKDTVIACETLWKDKLGSRAFGLNGN
jgi:hypothetical protein